MRGDVHTAIRNSPYDIFECLSAFFFESLPLHLEAKNSLSLHVMFSSSLECKGSVYGRVILPVDLTFSSSSVSSVLVSRRRRTFLSFRGAVSWTSTSSGTSTWLSLAISSSMKERGAETWLCWVPIERGVKPRRPVEPGGTFSLWSSLLVNR